MNSISIIIPWSNRKEIEESLIQNRTWFNKPFIEVIIVNCGGDFKWLYNSVQNLEFENIKILDICNTSFNKSLALNLGAFVSRSHILFFLDADVIIEDDIFEMVEQYMLSPCFITIERVFESNPELIQKKEQWIREMSHQSQFIFADNSMATAETNRIRFNDGSRSAPGLIFVRKEDFLTINGMNSKLRWWGWEDIDFHVRLQNKCKIPKYSVGKATHISHNDDARNLLNGNRMESESANFYICYSEYNRNNFDGSYKEDVRNMKEHMQLYEL